MNEIKSCHINSRCCTKLTSMPTTSYQSRTLVLLSLLLLSAPAIASASRYNFNLAAVRPLLSSTYKSTIVATTPSDLYCKLRGGSSTTADDDDDDVTEITVDDKETRAAQTYRWQQHLYLQSRSLQLRQALIQRGLSALDHQSKANGPSTPQPVDWDCAVATLKSPKSCLYSFDAPTGHKVLAPIDTQQWITLSSLVRLRRTDPTKIESLWHSKYAILKSWFNASPYSLYKHLSLSAAVLSYLLDTPWVLGLAIAVTAVVGFIVTLPVWETLALLVATNSTVWMNWPQWGRFVHAALPLKILLGQLAWKGIAGVFGRIYGNIRGSLIEWECQLWEQAVPLTIIENSQDSGASSSDSLLSYDYEVEESDDE